MFVILSLEINLVLLNRAFSFTQPSMRSRNEAELLRYTVFEENEIQIYFPGTKPESSFDFLKTFHSQFS